MVQEVSVVQRIVNRETRVLNRNFSLAEYGNQWTKIERYLFIEIYNVIKDFYMDKEGKFVKEFSSESITLEFPVSMIDERLLKVKNRTSQLVTASKGLMEKQIQTFSEDKDSGQRGFYFINMFTYIKYDPKEDKKNLEVKIPYEIYNEMLPIESFCLLDLKLIENFNSGNTIRLYEVFKSYAFRKSFSIEFDDLRRQLGFFKTGVYVEWRDFNAKVLKPAVNEINRDKEFDIEVIYKKARGSTLIDFNIIQHHKISTNSQNILSLNQPIDMYNRKPNRIQMKFLQTLLKNCAKTVQISNPSEMLEWIISDLISMAQKQFNQIPPEPFDFRKFCNAISKQIREEIYSRPYSHEYFIAIYEEFQQDEIQKKLNSPNNKVIEGELID